MPPVRPMAVHPNWAVGRVSLDKLFPEGCGGQGLSKFRKGHFYSCPPKIRLARYLKIGKSNNNNIPKVPLLSLRLVRVPCPLDADSRLGVRFFRRRIAA